MNHRFVLGMCFSFFTAAVPVMAFADDAPAAPSPGPVTVVSSQFTDKVEHAKPVGGGDAITPSSTATYWLEVGNTKEATQVTLVWKLDGTEVARQSLDVGHAPKWRTWGSCPTRKAHAVEVTVLDKDGATLKTDTLTLSGS